MDLMNCELKGGSLGEVRVEVGGRSYKLLFCKEKGKEGKEAIAVL